MSNDAEFILSELFKTDRQPTVKNDGIWIRCTNPEHSGGQERTPSLRIRVENTKYPNTFWCFGCGWKGHYNDIAKMLGLQKIDKDFRPVGFRKLSFREKQKTQSISQFKSSTFKWPDDKEWRGVKGKTINRYGAELSDIRHDLEEPRLIFPVKMWGENVGYIYAMIRDSQRDENGRKLEKSYINSSGPWKEKALFGFDRARRLLKKYPDYPLWIVEGPRDVFHVSEAGCIVVGNIGSSFSKEKADLIVILNPKRLLVASDADSAGNKLAASVKEHMKGRVSLTRIKF